MRAFGIDLLKLSQYFDCIHRNIFPNTQKAFDAVAVI